MDSVPGCSLKLNNLYIINIGGVRISREEL